MIEAAWGTSPRAVDCDLSREVAVKLLRADRQDLPNREDFGASLRSSAE